MRQIKITPRSKKAPIKQSLSYNCGAYLNESRKATAYCGFYLCQLGANSI